MGIIHFTQHLNIFAQSFEYGQSNDKIELGVLILPMVYFVYKQTQQKEFSKQKKKYC